MLAFALLASACHDSTGLHLFAHLGSLNYDALALQITRPAGAAGTSAPQVLVDPATSGRYPGPFQGGDQDVYVYLPDDLDGARLQCTMTALRSSATVAQGESDATVHRQAIEDVQIVMIAPSSTGATGGTSGRGGAGGTGGAPPPAAGGMGGSSPPPATGGTTGSQPSANGVVCNTATDCASGHCVDGVCCESECSAACSSCATAGAPGLCRAAPAGVPDPRGICADMGAATCGTNGLCDVSGHCAKYPAGTMCAPPACKNGEMMKGASTCDGAGACHDGATMKCHCTGDTCA